MQATLIVVGDENKRVGANGTGAAWAFGDAGGEYRKGFIEETLPMFVLVVVR